MPANMGGQQGDHGVERPPRRGGWPNADSAPAAAAAAAALVVAAAAACLLGIARPWPGARLSDTDPSVSLSVSLLACGGPTPAGWQRLPPLQPGNLVTWAWEGGLDRVPHFGNGNGRRGA